MSSSIRDLYCGYSLLPVVHDNRCRDRLHDAGYCCEANTNPITRNEMLKRLLYRKKQGLLEAQKQVAQYIEDIAQIEIELKSQEKA